MIHRVREEVEEQVFCFAKGQVDRDRPWRIVDVVGGE